MSVIKKIKFMGIDMSMSGELCPRVLVDVEKAEDKVKTEPTKWQQYLLKKFTEVT